MPTDVPRIAVTPGEPAGVGPELVAKLCQSGHDAEIVAVADPDLLAERADAAGMALELRDHQPDRPAAAQSPGTVTLLRERLPRASVAGTANPANATYVVETIRRAVQGCLAGEFDALVTGPVSKSVIRDAGIDFTGQTELLGELAGGTPVMMLTTPGLRVALVTTHLALRAVPERITRSRVTGVLRTVDSELRRRYASHEPRLAVCGLNPHAGEGGHLGDEEDASIAPAIRSLRDEGLHVRGPLPADTVFTPRELEGADAVVAMYHDQGLPVLKHMGFGRAVNVTLGLEMIRTSVDHGTAFDLAGTGGADAGSMEAALAEALELARRRRA